MRGLIVMNYLLRVLQAGRPLMDTFILIKVVIIGIFIVVNILLSLIILDMMQAVIHEWRAGR